MFKLPGTCKATMGTWKSKKISKKGKASQTPGRAKNAERCSASKMDKYFCRRNRSYKHPEYNAWCDKYDAINGIRR